MTRPYMIKNHEVLPFPKTFVINTTKNCFIFFNHDVGDYQSVYALDNSDMLMDSCSNSYFSNFERFLKRWKL